MANAGAGLVSGESQGTDIQYDKMGNDLRRIRLRLPGGGCHQDGEILLAEPHPQHVSEDRIGLSNDNDREGVGHCAAGYGAKVEEELRRAVPVMRSRCTDTRKQDGEPRNTRAWITPDRMPCECRLPITNWNSC